MVDDGPAARREFTGLLVVKQKVVLPGVKESGRDGVDPYFRGVFLRHVDCQPLREIADTRLGGVVGNRAGQRPEAGHGCDGDNVPLPLLRHDLGEHLAGNDGAEQIEVDHLF